MFFEAPDVRCPKRLLRRFFGLFKTLDYHDFALMDASRWGPPRWYLYEATGKCKACGTSKRVFGISEEELRRAAVAIPTGP